MKETTRDEGGLRAALDTCKFVWLTGVVLWHAAGCGSAPACFGGDAASLGVAAYIPQLLGVVMLSGLMLASGVKDAIRTVSIRSALQPALVALLYQLVDLLIIRPVLLGGNAPIATAGHVWFLYSLSMARLLGLVVSGSGVDGAGVGCELGIGVLGAGVGLVEGSVVDARRPRRGRPGGARRGGRSGVARRPRLWYSMSAILGPGATAARA